MRHVLSKSTYLLGHQCTKRLALHKFMPGVRNPVDAMTEAAFERGTSIGMLARKLFAGGIDASPPNPFSYHLSVSKTKRLIERKCPVIYEAAFQFKELLCAADILVFKNGKAFAFEVKSSTEVKPYHITDIAFQYFVLKNCGIELEDYSIIHVNKNYTRTGELDLSQLFSVQSVLEEVKQLENDTAELSELLIRLVKSKQVPDVMISPHCYDPYECDFTGYCFPRLNEPTVFDLTGNLKGLDFDLYRKGIIRMKDIPEDISLPDAAKFQVEQFRKQQEHFDPVLVKNFLNTFVYPIHFIDFEAYMPGVPEYDQSRPYQAIPFQYSLHILPTPDSEPVHKDFLAAGNSDPRVPFYRQLLSDVGKAGTLVAYNAAYEKTRLRELAQDFSIPALMALNERFIDLMTVFRNRWYYHPSFNGSYSIKKILPVMVNQSLSYDSLSIKDGTVAGLSFLKMREQQTKPETEKIRQDLLQYCALDSLAMVKIFQYLQKRCNESNPD